MPNICCAERCYVTDVHYSRACDKNRQDTKSRKITFVVYRAGTVRELFDRTQLNELNGRRVL